jgi:GNAT superfamily N-acetyltransferase
VKEDLPSVEYRWLSAPSQVDDNLSAQLVDCWWKVSNAGGAVGFPFLPVDVADVSAALDELVQSLDPTGRSLLVAVDNDMLLGWLVLERNPSRLRSHWARVLRVQTSLAARGLGMGRALMSEVARIAREDLRLEQLHIEVRGGQGLEAFYQACGWQEVGRWPGALRLGPDDDRDEILMVLALHPGL